MKELAKLKYWLARMKEPSTWNAIAVLLGTIGYSMPEETGDGMMMVAGGALTLINIFWKKDSQAQ